MHTASYSRKWLILVSRNSPRRSARSSACPRRDRPGSKDNASGQGSLTKVASTELLTLTSKRSVMASKTTETAFRLAIGLEVDIESKKVHIYFEPQQYARVPHAMTDEAAIEAAWLQAKAKNPKIFNSSKFRLGGPIVVGKSEVTIPLGLTDYRDYIATNRHVAVSKLAADGLRDHGFDGAHLSNALGCETILITGDHKLMLLRRSSTVATHAGQYNGPSGHAEPERCDLADPKSIQNEVLCESIAAEIAEECGVPRSAICTPKLIGCALESNSLKPDLLFETTTHLTSTHIAEFAYQEASEGWESDRFIFLSLAEVRNHKYLEKLQLTAVTEAAIFCYLNRKAHASLR